MYNTHKHMPCTLNMGCTLHHFLFIHFSRISVYLFVGTNDASSCHCGCYNLHYSFDNLEPSLQQEVLEMKKKLTVSTKNTTSYKRSLISVGDSRPSAKAVGSCGIVFLLVIGVLVVLGDFSRFCLTPVNNID